MSQPRIPKGKARFFFNHIGVEAELGIALLNIDEDAWTPSLPTVPGMDQVPNGTPPATSDEVEVLTSAGWGRHALLPLGDEMQSFAGMRLRALDLTSLRPGRYVLRYQGECSPPLIIEKNALLRRTLDAVLGYFESQHCESPWDDCDRFLSVFGQPELTVDVHGGWYDAAGDVGKYLSHLSYANFMNPQQTPLVVWGLLDHLESHQGRHPPGVRQKLLAEAAHGASFLRRMLSPEGYFYTTIFDQWSKDLDRRQICSYRGRDGEMAGNVEAGFRQGGGVAIAALARAGRLLGKPEFIEEAERAFAHLEEHNLKYLDDGQENVIDDYCALLASAELAATGDDHYADRAWSWAKRLMARLRDDGPHPGWLVADGGERPFFHAVEAGLPAIALMRMAEVVPFRHDELLAAATRLMEFEIWATEEGENAFGYARQYTQDAQGKRQLAYFMPHENETGYWWQGENARLASLAAAAGKLARMTTDETLENRLRCYAWDQLDWICGKNPFDVCMLHGFGRNNVEYLPEWPNAVGGICNGITSSFDDESDADMGLAAVDAEDGWRWHEQWLPHAAWYLIAVGELAV